MTTPELSTFGVRLFLAEASGKTREIEPFTIEARDDDDARTVIAARLREWGHVVRSVSALAADKTGRHYAATVTKAAG